MTVNNSFAVWIGFWCIAQVALLWFYLWLAFIQRLQLSPQRKLRSYHQGLLWVFAVPIMGWWLQFDRWILNEKASFPQPIVSFSKTLPQGFHSLPASSLADLSAISKLNTIWTSTALVVWLLGMTMVFAYYYWNRRQLLRWTNKTTLWREIGSLEIRVAALIIPMSYVLNKRKVIVLDHETFARPVDRNLVISHEIQHMRQGDHNVIRLNLVFRGLFWHNPILYLLLRKLSELEELSCDAMIVKRFTANSFRYCQSLLEITQRAASLPHLPENTSQGLSHRILSPGPNCSLLRKRIKNIDQELRKLKLMNVYNDKQTTSRSILRSKPDTRQRIIWITTVLIASFVGSASVVLARSQIAPGRPFHNTENEVVHHLPNHLLINQKLRSIVENPQLNKSYQSALAKLETNQPQLRAIVTEFGLPEYMLAIPIVESQYNPSAGSNRLDAEGIPRSLGVWQMIPSTARKFGLVVNSNTDQRLELSRETRAAFQLLQSLYDEFGTWPLAITAYHLGSQALNTILAAHPNKDLFELVAKKHVSDYAVEIYAAAQIIEDPTLLKSR